VTSKQQSLLFRFTRWDAIEVVIVSAFVASHVALALLTERLGPIGLIACAPTFMALGYLTTLCAHNHVHTPIFRAKVLNRAFELLLSACSRGPQSGYAEVHRSHHDHAISYTRFPLAQTLHVDSIGAIVKTVVVAYISAFRLQYVLAAISLFVLRRPPPRARGFERPFETFDAYFDELMASALARISGADRLTQAALGAEVFTGALFSAALCAISPGFFLLFYVPVSILRDTLFIYSEYCHHYGADDVDPRADSVSSYGVLSNLLTLNVAHHQEHHARPGVHWTRLPGLRAEMLGERERRVVPHAILLNPFYPLTAPARDDAPTP